MSSLIIWIISIATIAMIIFRPLKLPEYIWSVTGAILLILLQQLTPAEAFRGVAKGSDVYLFLIGMMLLAESAREEGLFDWLAAHALRLSSGSPKRLFLMIYGVGTVVTMLLSNDATAVVLTPAVACVVKTAKVRNPLPYLYICAFIANAASFLLPISNPANLVVYGNQMPPLLAWLGKYLLPSTVSIVSTYLVLFYAQKRDLIGKIEIDPHVPAMSSGAKLACWGILLTTMVLVASSALNWDLGLPTAATGILTAAVVVFTSKKKPMGVIRKVSWSVLPLVAGLFVIVGAVNKTGITQRLADFLNQDSAQSAAKVISTGIPVAVLCNVVNNLPAGLLAGNVIQAAHLSEIIKSAILIGIDLGPNLSVTGSLATILWLIVLRRENLSVSSLQFLKLGAVVMTIPLLLTLASLLFLN